MVECFCIFVLVLHAWLTAFPVGKRFRIKVDHLVTSCDKQVVNAGSASYRQGISIYASNQQQEVGMYLASNRHAVGIYAPSHQQEIGIYVSSNRQEAGRYSLQSPTFLRLAHRPNTVRSWSASGSIPLQAALSPR